MYDMGPKIKAMRLRRGMTQKALANKISKSVAAVSGYENDTQIPPTDVLISIAEALHAPISYFLELDSKDTYSTAGLTPKQREVLDMIYQEFTCCSDSPAAPFSQRQMDILQKLMVQFSNPGAK